MKKFVIFLSFLVYISLFAQNNRSLVGQWTFDNIQNLTEATVGNDLILVGTHSAVAGPNENDGAINIGPGSYYKCFHDIPANGGSTDWVNVFTIVMDVKIPQQNQWYCLYQTNYNNNNDGDWFINPAGKVGVGPTGYSTESVEPNEWYRLAISVSLGNHYDYYLDGQLLFHGGAQDFDGRFALYSAENENLVLFFADDNGEEGSIDIANILLYDTDLSDSEIAQLGGYGHEIQPPDNPYMASYLQTPTPNSIYISWHALNSLESKVRYGLTEDLELLATGDSQELSADRIWHTVKLTNLLPDTKYYYQCISDTAHSEIKTFRTQPETTTGHIRFVVYGDSRTNISKHTEIIHAIKETIEQEYNSEVEDYLNVVLNVGDIVTYGPILDQFQNEYFTPISSISGNVPFMVSIGNHESESEYFYDYMKYDDFQGDEGEKYYSFQLGSVLFIALNSNIQGESQINWLSNVLDSAQTDENISMIFVYNHHPGRTEIWPDGNTSWVQESVIPLLSQYEKVEALFYGHSHDYERGVCNSGNLRLLLSGGGGADLDRWGMYDNQENYPEIQRSHDYYCYTIFDVNQDNKSYIAKSYSLGNNDVQMDNVVFDSFSRYINAPNPQIPIALSPNSVSSNIFVVSPFSSQADILCSQFQITNVQNEWENCEYDTTRYWEDIYGDSGAPDYIPVNLNENIQLNRLRINDLQPNTHYWWRVRYRDQNLHWSQWSEPAEFTYTEISDSADFTADILEGSAPLEVRFTDLSIGNNISDWEWDFDDDGITDSFEQDPVFTYEISGVYTVLLTVTIDGIQYQSIKSDYITVNNSNAENILSENTKIGLSNYPNPFNPTTTISYQISKLAKVKLTIYNIKGQIVRTLVNEKKKSGFYKVLWNGRDEENRTVASGVYLYKLSVNGKNKAIRKCLLVK